MNSGNLGDRMTGDVFFCTCEFSRFSSINIHNSCNEGRELLKKKKVRVDIPDSGNCTELSYNTNNIPHMLLSLPVSSVSTIRKRDRRGKEGGYYL